MRRAAGDRRKGKFNAERYPRVCPARDPTCSTHRFHVNIRFLKLITTREGEKREIRRGVISEIVDYYYIFLDGRYSTFTRDIERRIKISIGGEMLFC